MKKPKLLPKINLTHIVRDHLGTLKSYSTQKPSFNDWFTFLIMPLLISVFLIYQGFIINKESFSTFITILSILGGFSFNLLAIIFGYHDKIMRNVQSEKNNLKANIKKTYVQEIHQNISFSIFNAILCIILLIITRANFPTFELGNTFIYVELNIWQQLFNCLLYFSLIFYLFTLLMIIKRMSIILKKDFS